MISMTHNRCQFCYDATLHESVAHRSTRNRFDIQYFRENPAGKCSCKRQAIEPDFVANLAIYSILVSSRVCPCLFMC